MSIIERIADLLGPTGRPADMAETVDDAATPGIDVVERVVVKGARSSEAFGHSESERTLSGITKQDANQRPSIAHSSPIATKLLKIDRERLHRQNLIMPDAKRSPVAEAFRRIKRQILLNLDRPKAGTLPNLVMVTSSVPGEGKSFCATNLALSIALEMDHTVVLVDGDVARPSIPEMLGVEEQTGLMDVLLNPKTPLRDVLFRTDIGKLMLLPAGAPHRHATEMLASAVMRNLLGELTGNDANRIIVFDSPPILAASEAGVLANLMGQVVVVVEAEETTEGVLKTALGRIETANIVGLLLNKVRYSNIVDGYGEYGYDAT